MSPTDREPTAPRPQGSPVETLDVGRPGLRDAVVTLGAAALAADGVAALGEQTMLDLADPDADARHLGVVGDDGALVAYAQVGRPGQDGSAAELVVHPEARRRGTGTALLEAVLGTGPVGVWAHGDLPAARALAGRAGLTVVRELLRLGRELPATPEVALPSDVRVRPFVVGQDEEAWLDVNRRAFAAHREQGRMSRADLEARMREPWFDPQDLLLAVDQAGTLLASVWMKVEPGAGGAPAEEGELYVLGVDPGAQGRGLGRALTARTLAHLTARGLRRVTLYVEGDNAAALRTYTAAGFRRLATDVQYARLPEAPTD